MAGSQAQMATFESAFARLRDVVKPQDAVDFQSTTMKDVFDAARQIQEIQRRRRSMRYMGRLKPFLQCLEKYSRSIDTLCNGTPFLPWVWAPVKLILQFASDHPTILDKLLDAYSQIADALPRFDRFQSAFSYDANLKQALALVYEDILEFHRHTYLFFQRGAWHIFFDSLWKDFGVRFLGILDSLQRHRDLVDQEASSIAIIEAKRWRVLQKDDIDRRESERRDRQLQDCISWLMVNDHIQENNLERISQRRQVGTCDWILSSVHLRSWVENQNEESVLWLKGIPGAGKSVLTSHIIQILRQNPDVTTIFYFCNSHADKGDLCSQVLRTLILELLRSHPHLTSHIFTNYIRQGRTPSLVQIKKLLPDLLSTISSTRIIIDGLDECQENDQRAILTELLSAVKHSVTSCKLFISSRAETYISRILRKRPTISLSEKREKEKVDKDIRRYVKHSLIELRASFPSTVVDDAERTIVKKANGMFLWVRLVISELLDRESVYELQKAAHNLPQGLHRAYQRILDRIRSEYSEYSSQKAMKILQWMACAFRPLKVFEIQNGLVFETADVALSDRTKPSKNLLELCKPMIEEGFGNTVDFVHFSAKEYILHPTSGPFLHENDAHLTVSYACATYLSTSHCLIGNQILEEEQVLRVVKGFHCLHQYAHEFLVKHALRYAELQYNCNSSFSEILSAQLQKLCFFRKKDLPTAFKAALCDSESLQGIEQQLSHLNLPINLRLFIRDMVVFQEMSVQDNHQHQDPREIQRLEIENDPTIFSEILYQHQDITEFILETPDDAIAGVNMELVSDFKRTYGESALRCRYSPCPRGTRGFSTARDRNMHESSHTRRFKCAESTCEFYDAGFSTKTALQKHNQTYHRKLDDFVLPIRRRLYTTDLREMFQVHRSSSMSSTTSLATPQRQPGPSLLSSKSVKVRGVFEGSRRLRKEHTLTENDYEGLLKLNPKRPYVTDENEEILRRAEVFHNPTKDVLPSVEIEPTLSSRKKLSLRDYKDKLLKTNIQEKLQIQETQLSVQAIEMDNEPYTIKCICESSDDDGNKIYCEKCDTWQHIKCYYLGREEEASREDFVHYCADCKPQPVTGQPTSMPGSNQQPRPGQLGPQAGQFTPQQQALNQFMMANPGQRPPPSLMTGMTPQQQMYLQQSLAQASQTAMQRRPDNPQFDQRALMQLDNMPFPPGVLNIPQMPRGIPAEVKKWGQLKHWLATNGNIPPEVMENLKNTQKMHYMDFMRRSKLLGPQAPQIGMNLGGPGAQNPMPVVTPGLAAPVAPIGQAPMQMPNSMNIVPQALRQPTPQDVLAIRNHPSGRFIGFTDEQLRNFIIRQQEQWQNQQRVHMANRIAQINVQQPRPNPPNGPANGNQASPAQQPPVQATQPKPPTSEPAATAVVAVPAVNARAARQQQQPNQKPTPTQTSSPAQPPKNNLKRASSDNVVEVPNPNSQQPAQEPPGLRTLPPEAVAKLTPDRRKQYEALLRQQYARQQNINSDDAVKLREIMAEENQRAIRPLSDILMD